MIKLDFFTSLGGFLFYNFLYLGGCVIVIFMLSYEWQLTHRKDTAYLLSAFVVTLFNLIFVNISLCLEIFFDFLPRSSPFYHLFNWNLEALSIIFITWAFLFPLVREKQWLKRYFSYNIFTLIISLSVISTIWPKYLGVFNNGFWEDYYYNIWLMGILGFTISYLHFYAEKRPDFLVRIFLGILFLVQATHLLILLAGPNQVLKTVEHFFPALASLTLILAIYKNITLNLMTTNAKLIETQEKLNLANRGLETKVQIRTRELSEKNIELLRFKEFHENVLQSLTNGIVVTDAKDNIMAVNQAMEKNLKIRVENLRDRNFHRIFPSKQGTDWRGILREIVKDGHNVRLNQLSFRPRHMKEDVIVNVLGQPLKDKEEKNIGSVLIMEFITERIRLEEKMKRSQHLTLMGQIAAGVAHEIRNPLNSLSINLQLINRAIRKSKIEPSNKVSYLFKVVNDEINRLDGIVNEFLTFARPPQMHLMQENLNDLVTAVARLIEKEAVLSNIRLEVKTDKTISPVLLDEGQMKQVLLNICYNAIQAMSGQKEGKLTIQTGMENKSDSQGIWICISDTGSGIPKSDQQKIFEPFYSTRKEGLGLGLAIAHRIMEEHNGFVSLSSKAGCGTKFILTLPVIQEQMAVA
jgi:PAS domain S-box-containing protein